MITDPFAHMPQIEPLATALSVEELELRLRTAPTPCLLESHLDIAAMGRFHIFAAHPIGSAVVFGSAWQTTLGRECQRGESDPWAAIDAWWRSWSKPLATPHSDLPMLGGAIGYIGYEMGKHFEPIGDVERERLDAFPDLHLHLYDEVLLVEVASGRASFVHRGRPGVDQRRWFEQPVLAAPHDESTPTIDEGVSIADDDYLGAVESIRESIRQGDVYEANLTRCHFMRGGPSVWQLHQRLRRRQPVPYAALLPWEPVAIVSASPECFLKRRGLQLETRPIKGTLPRGANDAEDFAHAAALLASKKDRAELAMIIDLERNDLGRVCRPGTIEVVEEAAIEFYSTVIHTTATVRGELEYAISPVELLRATFPGGSITGAPKIAAMQTIQRLEPYPRKAYTGSVGWIAPNGDVDLSIAIRTAMRHGDRTLFSVGGAITWDSDPRAELAELEAKGRAVLAAMRSEE